MEVLEIDLNNYVNIVENRYYSYSFNTKNKKWPELGDRDNGLRVAKDSQLSKKIGKVDQVRLTLTNGVPIRDNFLKAFLGPTARKIGPHALLDKIAIVGNNTDLLFSIQRYLKEEADNIIKRAEKKKEEKEALWSEDKIFFLPEIGTKLALCEDWEFDLHRERRNDKFFPQIGIPVYWKLNASSVKIKILKGSHLTVDRIYIRKGVKEYSSVTFYVKKGAQVEYNGGLYKMRGARFWAKLHDVNRLRVQVDLNTVPGLEE